MNAYVFKRGLLYAVAAFMTCISDEIVPVLRTKRWPDGYELTISAILGTIAVVLILRAFVDGSVARVTNGEKGKNDDRDTQSGANPPANPVSTT